MIYWILMIAFCLVSLLIGVQLGMHLVLTDLKEFIEHYERSDDYVKYEKWKKTQNNTPNDAQERL